MIDPQLTTAIDTIPAGGWAVGVSGGTDSIALLSLLRLRPDLDLHVAHLDHQTRGSESDGDARFVQNLCRGWNIPCTCRLRGQIEGAMDDLPANPSARYRAARMELFKRLVCEKHLSGVILAHHADDQAETVLHRLLRGSRPENLWGIARRSTLGQMLILRPLLGIRRQALARHLESMGQAWREDGSNQSDRYLRNRLRKLLAGNQSLSRDLLNMSLSSGRLRQWMTSHAPSLPKMFDIAELDALPRILAIESSRRWLLAAGVPRDELTAPVLDRLLQMVRDAGSASRVHFPGKLLVYRRRGQIRALAT